MLSRHPGVELEKKTQDDEPVLGSNLEVYFMQQLLKVGKLLSEYPVLEEPVKDSNVNEELYSMTIKEKEEIFPFNMQLVAREQEK